MSPQVEIEFTGFREAAGPARRVVHAVTVAGSSFEVTVSLPTSVYHGLEAATRRRGEGRDAFRRRVEEALVVVGRRYSEDVGDDDELRAAAARAGRWDHELAGHELGQLRRSLR